MQPLTRIVKKKFFGMNIAKAFTVRELGRSELASYYAPGISPQSAWKKLKLWIHRSPGLEERLAQTGYDRRQRTFTPRQVSLIIDAIGEP